MRRHQRASPPEHALAAEESSLSTHPLQQRGFCGCRIVHVPESDEVDRPVTAYAGRPCQARIPTALKDEKPSLPVLWHKAQPRIAKSKRHACCKLPQWPRKECSKYHASGIKREACGDGCGQVSPSQRSRKRESMFLSQAAFSL